MSKLVVGQTVYKPNGTPVKVTKVGRKYFEIENGYRSKYHIEDGKLESNFGGTYYLIFSEQEALDKLERNKLEPLIRKAFSGYGNLPYTLEQLRQVATILNLHTDND